MKKIVTLLALFVVLSFSGVAAAALLQQNFQDTWDITYTPGVSTTLTDTLSVSKFNQSLGTLQSITISMSTKIDQDLYFSKNGSASKTYGYSTTAAMGISNTDWSVLESGISSSGVLKTQGSGSANLATIEMPAGNGTSVTKSDVIAFNSSLSPSPLTLNSSSPCPGSA